MSKRFGRNQKRVLRAELAKCRRLSRLLVRHRSELHAEINAIIRPGLNRAPWDYTTLIATFRVGHSELANAVSPDELVDAWARELRTQLAVFSSMADAPAQKPEKANIARNIK